MANLFNGWNDLDRLWPGGIIPYDIDPSVDAVQPRNDLSPREAIEAAIEHWEEHTPVRFVAHDASDEHWVLFVFDETAESCNSGLGRNPSPSGPHRIEFSEDGCSAGSLIHEIGHRVGLVHEHVRPDRDQHIIIHRDRFDPDWNHFHGNVIALAGETLGDYDYRSVMHYDSSGVFDPTVTLLPDGYEGLAFDRHDGRTRCLAYKKTRSMATLFDVRADGTLATSDDLSESVEAPRPVLLGKSGWDELRYVWLERHPHSDIQMLVGLKRSTGEICVWETNETGLTKDAFGDDYWAANPTLGYPVIGWHSFDTGNRRLFMFRGFDATELPREQVVDVFDLRSSGTFFTSPGSTAPQAFSITIEGHWTDFIPVHPRDSSEWVLVNRYRNTVARVKIDMDSLQAHTRHTWQIRPGDVWHEWDMVDISFRGDDIRIIAYGTDGFLSQYTLVPQIRIRREDSDGGRDIGSDDFRDDLPSAEDARAGREVEEPPEDFYRLDDVRDGREPGYDFMVRYRADDGERLAFLKRGRNSRVHYWTLANGAIGSWMGVTYPAIERRPPVSERDRTRLGNSVLSSGDIDALETLIRGNIEIRRAGEEDPLRRVSVAHIDQRVSDVAIYRINYENYLWAGDGKGGDASFHQVTNSGKFTGAWNENDGLSRWRTACFYMDPAGDEVFALFRNRNSGRIRRHAVTADGVDPDELETINTRRWDKMRTMHTHDGRTFIGFVDRGGDIFEIRPVEAGGTLGDPDRLDIGNKMDDVALLDIDGGLFIFLVGANATPEFYRYRPGESRRFELEVIGDESDRGELFRGWNAVVSLNPGTIALYDLATAATGIITGEQMLLTRATLPLYYYRGYWHAFNSFQIPGGTPCFVNATDGWRWD